MDIGVGLPTTVPDVTRDRLLTWAREADGYGFSTLGVLDRLVYDNHESLVSLAAAAAVTERIRLATTILIAPYRPGTALLAKQLASLDELSCGRLVVGLAAGGRDDDYRATGAAYGDRGRRLDALAVALREIWAGGGPVPGIGPRPGSGGPRLLFGGHSPAAMRRAARHGEGWIAGGSSAAGFGELARRAGEIWTAEGRTGRPRTVALLYACLGPDARATAERYLRAYYAFIGPKAEMAARAVITDERELKDTIGRYAAEGCDELLVFPCTADLGQLDHLARAALG
ncbi:MULTISPECIES: LLM class flavin-dependent oxidoreductase [unclassified Streptomyces]|uniref:LLM class flavin-dependent oxidoreductase n=1 Tax=unclassified Streptomyces TaxID=2593676 RepID=UPI000F4D62DE|nr:MULTISPECIES: LLM class flavin-dependent oxidoreductase [unclassified Streptomyces]MDH6453707.1 alkanesulfonate monooxygenase SsuD/methylene tetrahydromethanopterin reductase-like flavin-dependent oxidoreductase (luciferase family) [Streptomyces sp. SAI-119]MDH6495735.1 alkanesulfonate monooxygenase SsuD/methylene tetrahydromethanopterin reductase-like flavin-dependent oxidoreductase (luciferase family) [Streptomyces sp. SAI-149]QUC57370.1 LLM class flavin-dependent oxidoreductase [Streptomyc